MNPARYSLLACGPFLTLEARGSRCELIARSGGVHVQFGNPWDILEGLMARYELLDEVDLPFPLGGCFGFWGYDLKNFVEPKLSRLTVNDLELPDARVGFYDSLVVFDHVLGGSWIIATGLEADGSRSDACARGALEAWERRLGSPQAEPPAAVEPAREPRVPRGEPPRTISSLTRLEFIDRVRRAKEYIRLGHIYQVNLAHRLEARPAPEGWDLFLRMAAVSPAPYAAYFDAGEFQVVSNSPELFLRISGSHIQTRPIKGTRPRSGDPTRDAQWTYELQTSPKEMAELVMITDLLRNDLGKICEFGSVQVPELVRLERYAHVQHLVSTVEGRLRDSTTHLAALAACFPGGSVTGAPKFRAMQIIDELEPVSRGPYTGCLGYLGFNRESQLSILIRTAICAGDAAWFYAGAGIVDESDPALEYEETLAKARGFLAALELPPVQSNAGIRTTGPERTLSSQ